jgi:hypothetical protein
MATARQHASRPGSDEGLSSPSHTVVLPAPTDHRRPPLDLEPRKAPGSEGRIEKPPEKAGRQREKDFELPAPAKVHSRPRKTAEFPGFSGPIIRAERPPPVEPSSVIGLRGSRTPVIGLRGSRTPSWQAIAQRLIRSSTKPSYHLGDGRHGQIDGRDAVRLRDADRAGPGIG